MRQARGGRPEKGAPCTGEFAEEKKAGLKPGTYKGKRIYFGGLGDLGESNCMVRTMPSPSLTKMT